MLCSPNVSTFPSTFSFMLRRLITSNIIFNLYFSLFQNEKISSEHLFSQEFSLRNIEPHLHLLKTSFGCIFHARTLILIIHCFIFTYPKVIIKGFRHLQYTFGFFQ